MTLLFWGDLFDEKWSSNCAQSQTTTCRLCRAGKYSVFSKCWALYRSSYYQHFVCRTITPCQKKTTLLSAQQAALLSPHYSPNPKKLDENADSHKNTVKGNVNIHVRMSVSQHSVFQAVSKNYCLFLTTYRLEYLQKYPFCWSHNKLNIIYSFSIWEKSWFNPVY